jgi:uncharacterized protein
MPNAPRLIVRSATGHAHMPSLIGRGRHLLDLDHCSHCFPFRRDLSHKFSCAKKSSRMTAHDNSSVLSRDHMRVFRYTTIFTIAFDPLRQKNSNLLLVRSPPPPNPGGRAPIFEATTMANFTPISAAIGGALIGLSAVFLMMLNGRIAGITGVFAGLIDPTGNDRAWRATFVTGLIAAPLSAVLLGLTLPLPQMPSSLTVIAVAGLLVGFGTRLSNGCTSGHGVCGIARLSPRSIAATAIFMAAAIIVVALTRHVLGA